MYFSIGWPKTFTSKDVQCGELSALKYNRDRSLIAVISTHTVCVWCNKPRVLIFTYRRSFESVRENGSNIAVVWRPDSSTLAVTTSEGKIVFLEVQKNNGVYLYMPRQVNSSGYYQSSTSLKNGAPSLKLVEVAVVTVTGGIMSVAARREELFVCSGGGLMQRVTWDGQLENEPIPVHSILFTNDLETARAVPLEHEGVCFRAMQYSPLLGGFAVVLADGRGGFLSASTASFDSSDIIGLWAQDLHSSTCVAVNHRYRLIAYGCTNGECLVYGFDDITGALQISYKLVLSSKDYPDAIQKTGSVQCLSWTPDGCAIAVAWSWASHGGLAVWSVFGSLLLCTLGGDYGTSQESFLHNPLHVKSMGWGPEGYNLAMISTEEENGTTEDITQLQFVKSSLTVNPCMSNHEHLFLQSEECLYLNTGDMVSETNQTVKNYSGVVDGIELNAFGESPVGHSTLISNKHWQIIQIPHNYLESNWPVRYAAVDTSGSYIAVAGKTGVAHYSLASRKWKLFGNVSQEQSISCRGGLAWWNDFLIFPCYNMQTSSDQICFYPRSCNLDNAFAHSVKLPAPAFLINVFRNLLLTYCSDSRVIFYTLGRGDLSTNPTIEVSRVQEFSLASYVPHPLAVVHITLTTAYAGSKPLQGLDGVESLITNVAGWLLMFQKDKVTPDKERKTRKASFSPPVALASCVENVWTSSSSSLTKRHLMEALWLGCGAQGMKVWLPLFPGNDEKPPNFLSKRIMLPFQLNIYPLAILFQDAVVLGAATEPMALEVTSPVSPVSLSPQPFPFCTLERTTQVYLHHILRQLLRKNLGQQALLIANTCTELPYFPHVLELLLHDVLEEEATASGPIPDALLPRIVAFIQEFPQYLQTVVHCARKTEVALWGYLFSAVGNPRDLFKECLNSGQLETAASYLIILQNLEHTGVSKQHATVLLDAALEHCRWEIAKDLVRFLRCISIGELESPPRSPTGYKATPPHTPQMTMDDEDLTMTMPYIANPHARSTSVSKANQRGSLTRGGSLEKAHSHLSRTASLDKAPGSKVSVNERRGRSISSLPPTPTSAVETRKFMEMESVGHFFIETILNRHARILLSASRLKDLGRFGAYLDFDLVSWLTKERNRAAIIESYVDSLTAVHKQFDWPYPAVTQQGPGANLPTSPKPLGMTGRSAGLGSNTSNSNSACHTLDEIEVTMGTTIEGIKGGSAAEPGVEVEEAYLAPVQQDGIGRFSAEPSETSSVSYSMDGDDDSVWWVDGAASVDIEALRAQLAVAGSKQAQREIRYLLQLMMEASCYEWWLLLGLVLRDSDSVTECIERAVQNKDSSLGIIIRLKDGLAALDTWAERNCLGYAVFFGLHKIHWQILDETIASAKVVTAVQKDSSPPQESGRRSRHSSVSKEEEIPVGTEEEPRTEEGGENEKDDEFECAIC